MFNQDEIIDKINLDELYEKKKNHDIATTNNYNKILNRVHSKIKTTSRQQLSEQHCWFLVPEMLLGVPRYNQSLCIAYIIDKLQTNGFNVRYTHPNMLFISWSHWVPNYVREEIKKKTGTIIDGFGNIIQKDNDSNNSNNINNNINNNNMPNNLLIRNNKTKSQNSDTKNIDSYKPTGNLVYTNDIINSFNKSL